MNEILKMLNALNASELESIIIRANIILEQKRKKESENAAREQERLRQAKIAEEKRRLEEIAELQRKLQELQNQKIIIPEDPHKVAGNNSAAHNTAQPANSAQSPAMVSCPHCQEQNTPDRIFCCNCGQRIAAPRHSLRPQSTPRPAPAPQPQPAPRPAPAPQPQPARPAPAPQPQPASSQIRFADESMKKWVYLPGENIIGFYHEIHVLKPDIGHKYKYYMEITTKRILITRINSVASNVGVAFGLAGSLIRNAAGAGPKPYLEIPLTAITDCGAYNKKEFFIVADQTYVLKNKKYESFLPELVAKAKM